MAWLHVHLHSEALRMPVPMEVLLPQRLSDDTNPNLRTDRYSTLYLLHDMGDDHTSWIRKSAVERMVEGLPLAVVMPAGHKGWYTDMIYGRDYFRFITEELPVLCERIFPLSGAREERFIAGAGMGGYGAVKAGLLASHMFSTAASFFADVEVERIWDKLDPRMAHDIFGERAGLEGSSHDLFTAAEQLVQSDKPKPQLYMWSAGDEQVHSGVVRFASEFSPKGLSVMLNEPELTADSWKNRELCLESMLQHLPLRSTEAVQGGRV
jgi:putative tributyrin esterase